MFNFHFGEDVKQHTFPDGSVMTLEETTMPLKDGYSPATIQHNVSVELKAKNRRPMRQILAIVYDKAREAYRRSHPRGRFPKHLER